MKVSGKTITITGKQIGKTTITVTSKSGKKERLNVTVQKGRVTTKTLKVSETSIEIPENFGGTIWITATPDKISTGEKIKVTSSNKNVAYCNEIDQDTGRIFISPKKKGTCKITVKVGNKTKKVNVKVTEGLFYED